MKAIVAFTTAVLLVLSPLSIADSRQSINESRDISANEKIYIEVMRGDITINATNSNRITVTGKLDEKAEGFELTSENGFTRFEVKMPRSLNDQGRSDGSDLAIEVPANADVEFKGVNSKVSVSGITGSSKITTVNGDIKAEKLSNYVELSTVNGTVQSKHLNGRISLDTVNGKIDDKQSLGRLSLNAVNGKIKADSSASEVSLSIVNGSAELELTELTELKLSTVNGDIDVDVARTTAPRISGSSVSGDIELKLPATVNARFSLVANAGGSIKNKLSNDAVSKAKYGPGRTLNFTLGNGEGSVELKTVSGDLELDKK